MGPPVGKEQVLIGVNGDAGNAVGPRVVLGYGAPVAGEVAVGVEHGYPVQPFVGDVGVALGIPGDSGAPNPLAVAVAILAEFPDELFLPRLVSQVDLTDPGADAGAVPGNVADVFAAPAQHKGGVVLAQGHGNGV